MADNSDFQIPPDLKNKYPELIDLILAAESMNEVEKKYWIQVLPVVGEEQIEKLKNILTEEKKAIDELAKEYGEETEKNNEKPELERKRRMTNLRRLEEESEQKEKEEEENILADLENLNNKDN